MDTDLFPGVGTPQNIDAYRRRILVADDDRETPALIQQVLAHSHGVGETPDEHAARERTAPASMTAGILPTLLLR